MSRSHERLDIASALTRREAAVLQHLAAGREVLELGALLGFGTVTMAQVARRVTSVDPHDGYPFAAPRPTLAPFRANLDRYGVAGRVDVVVGKFDDVELPPADVAMIDLTGAYELTLRAMESCRCGVLAVHDFARSGCSGATRAIEEFARRHGKPLRVFDTLAVLE